MNLKSVILSLLLIGVTTKCLVKGLQCYVCEDCNEYEDFKELHICGEIPVETTIKPNLLPEQLENSSTKNPALKPNSKPGLPEDYLDSEETHDEVSKQNSTQKTTTKVVDTKENTSTQTKTTAKPIIVDVNTTTQKPSSESTPAVTQKPVTENKTTSSTSAVTTKKSKPILATDYDDYLEYEEPTSERRSSQSLLKINEPVCYMIKFQVNNTVITNRGCTTFINANKYLTCQSLYNGAPMESCRVCSSNGCNKFLFDEGDEDDHGLPINVARSLEKLSFVVLLLGALINRFVI